MQLRRTEGTEGITKEFEDAGTSRPVALTIEQKALLIRVLEDWAKTSSFDRMPAGLSGLHNALSEDLHDAEQQPIMHRGKPPGDVGETQRPVSLRLRRLYRYPGAADE